MMKKVFVILMLFVFLACTVGFMQTHTFAALDTNNAFTGTNTFNGSTSLSTITSSTKLSEIAAPSCLAGFDFLWADSTAHRVKECDNGGSATQVVHSGVDVSTADQVTVTHLASPLPQAQGGTGQNSSVTFPLSGVVSSTISSVDLTGQNAAITTTNLNSTTLVAGQYEVSWNAKITTVAGASSILGGLTLGWTDPDNTAQSLTVVATTLGGTVSQSSVNNTTGTMLLGVPVLLNVKASTNITYAFAYASNAANIMTYNLHIKLKALQ
jgi:hypothetical protein